MTYMIIKAVARNSSTAFIIFDKTHITNLFKKNPAKISRDFKYIDASLEAGKNPTALKLS